MNGLEILAKYDNLRKFKSELSKITGLSNSTFTQCLKRKRMSKAVSQLILKEYKKVLKNIGHCEVKNI